ncbi:MAG: hypothetical protein ACOC55_02010 [Candidatus Natronoplasma sp.]
MPKVEGNKKSELVATRLTPRLKKAVRREATREGMDLSEWIRTLVVRELRERDALPRKFSFENFEGER